MSLIGFVIRLINPNIRRAEFTECEICVLKERLWVKTHPDVFTFCTKLNGELTNEYKNCTERDFFKEKLTQKHFAKLNDSD